VEADDAGDEDVAAFEVVVGLGDIVGSDADALCGMVSVSLARSTTQQDSEEESVQQSWRLWPLRITHRSAWVMHRV
jgi:hypothetical protein